MMEEDFLVKAYQLDELNRCAFGMWYSLKTNVNPSSLLKEEFKELIVSRGTNRKAEILEGLPWKETAEKTSELIERAEPYAIRSLTISTVLTFPDYLSLFPYPNESTRVRLLGVPDMLVKNPLDPNFYCPVEIKSHKQVQEGDIRRILFYSLIMKNEFYPEAGFGRRKASRVHGFLWLNPEIGRAEEDRSIPAAMLTDMFKTKDFDEVPVKRRHSNFDEDFYSYSFSKMKHITVGRDVEEIINFQERIFGTALFG